MAYERTNWQNGDVISSEKLNKMEAGIEYACSLEHEVEDPTEGQVLKYDAEKGKFVNGDVAIETNIQNPTDGQTLKYDAASGKWVNGEGGSGSSTLVVHTTTGSETSGSAVVMDKTWQEIYDAMPNVVLEYEGQGMFTRQPILYAYNEAGNCYAVVGDPDLTMSPPTFSFTAFNTDSPNSYPQWVPQD